MKSLLAAAAIVAMIGTVLVTLTAVFFCMGMGANASPAAIRGLKFWMAGLMLLGVGGVVAGMVLMRAGQHGWAAGVAFLPSVIMLLIIIVALIVK